MAGSCDACGRTFETDEPRISSDFTGNTYCGVDLPGCEARYRKRKAKGLVAAPVFKPQTMTLPRRRAA